MSRPLCVLNSFSLAIFIFSVMILASLTHAQELPRLSIDTDEISISGVSSGGAMAIQVC